MNHWRLRSMLAIAGLVATHAAYAAPSDDADDDDADSASADAAHKGSGPTESAGSAAARADSTTKPELKADAAVKPEAALAEPAPVSKPPLVEVKSRWDATLYGFVEFDAMHDSTQGYADSANGNLVARRGTYAGDRGQTQATIKNSRLGLKFGAPTVWSIKPSAVFEMDFFGVQPTDVSQNDYYVLGTMRVRHAYMKLETPVVDVLAGQYHDLFGWGGSGMYPNTVAFLGVPGEVYHRNPQLRLSKTLGGKAVSFEVAAAAVRPVMRHSEVPDGEVGAKLSFNGWTGAASQGSGQPQLTPLTIGVSGIGRRFVIPQFIGQPRNSVSQTGWGFAANAVIPVIPARDVEDRSNALTFTAEFSKGTGIADLYTGTTGGAKFPELANPGKIQPPLVYPQDVDAGLITFDADLHAKTYNWTGFVVGAQYYLPISGGKVWVSGTYSQMTSDNILLLTPAASWGAVYKSARYFDVNLFVAPSPATVIGASFQATNQTYGDGATPTNLRAELAIIFFL
jgi:hypothetical protein